MAEKRSAYTLYSLTYHIVFVTQYRRPLLTGKIAETVESECRRLLDEMGGKLEKIDIQEDHVYLLADLVPAKPISEQVKVLKMVTARTIRRECGDFLEQRIGNDNFWTRGYYIATAEGMRDEDVGRYIHSLQSEEDFLKNGKRKRGRPWDQRSDLPSSV